MIETRSSARGMPSAKQYLTSERPCELQAKKTVKKRSVKVKMLADGKFATRFAWAISAYPQKGSYDNPTSSR
jgi:hypothetical protein